MRIRFSIQFLFFASLFFCVSASANEIHLLIKSGNLYQLVRYLAYSQHVEDEINAPDENGFYPIQLAEDNCEMLRVLQRAGAVPVENLQRKAPEPESTESSEDELCLFDGARSLPIAIPGGRHR